MQASDEDWARSYAKQALSDLNAREILARASSEKCHRLHFLQMAAEKVCKAHLVKKGGHEAIRKSHAYVAKHLPIIARYFYAILYDNNEMARWEIDQIKRIAEEIELLAPACSHGDVRKDNSEYPWEDSTGKIQVPCEYRFPNIDDGDKRIGRVLKLIRTAAESYIR